MRADPAGIVALIIVVWIAVVAVLIRLKKHFDGE